jgi:hypothetical protein
MAINRVALVRSLVVAMPVTSSSRLTRCHVVDVVVQLAMECDAIAMKSAFADDR